MPTVETVFNGLIIEWDSAKAELVSLQHDVTFDEAMTVFDDPFALTDIDFREYEGEERYITLGYSKQNRLLIVVWTLRDIRYRLITAMKANSHAQKRYKQHARH